MAEILLWADDSLFRELKKHENISEIADKMVEEASPVIVKRLKTELRRHKRTGELVNSVKASKAMRDKDDNSYTLVRPRGNSILVATPQGKVYGRLSMKKVRNMEKLAWLEYGNSQGQEPTPVIEDACEKAHNDVIAKMTEVYEKETKT